MYQNQHFASQKFNQRYSQQSQQQQPQIQNQNQVQVLNQYQQSLLFKSQYYDLPLTPPLTSASDSNITSTTTQLENSSVSSNSSGSPASSVPTTLALAVAQNERGRQYQIPKRYEFQKKIPLTRTSSQHTILKKLRLDDQRIVSTDRSSNLAQLKRHSIASIAGYSSSTNNAAGSRGHVLNTYNDTKVFETVAPSKRNYILDRPNGGANIQGPSALSPYSPPINLTRRKMIQSQGAPSNLFKSLHLQDQGSNGVTNFGSRSISRARSEDGIAIWGKMGKKVDEATDNISRNKKNMLGRTDNDNSTADSNTTDEDDEDEAVVDEIKGTDNDIDDKNDFDLGYIAGDNIKFDLNENMGQEYSVEQLPMRTQHRQLVIKEEIDGENNTAGNAWLKFATAEKNRKINIDSNQDKSKEPVLEDSLESLIEGDLKENTDNKKVWVTVSLEQRNAYEKISNDLRKMILFNKKPMLKSIERYVTCAENENMPISNTIFINKDQNSESVKIRTVPAKYLDSHGKFKLNVGSFMLKDLWCDAHKSFSIH